MKNLNFNIYVCLAIPLLLTIFVLKKHLKTGFVFLFLGLTICVYCGELNKLFQNGLVLGDGTYSVAIAPFIEEILKSIPLLIFCFLKKPDKQNLLDASLLLGIGFATQENAFVLASFREDSSVFLSVVRALGAGMMHIVTSLLIGHCLFMIIKKNKHIPLFTVLTVLLAILYHAIFNFIEISAFQVIGYFLPLVTFIPLIVYLKIVQTAEKKKEKEGITS